MEEFFQKTDELKQEIRVHIRWMIRRDMPEILDIEAKVFEFPWLEEDFILCLRGRNTIGMVAEHNNTVVGFMIYELSKLSKARIHVVNFVVAPDCQRQSVGTQMVAKLISKLSNQRYTCITLEVRETNLGAQMFFRTCGFRAVSVLRNFYEDTPEDAYLMRYLLCKKEPVPVFRGVNRISGAFSQHRGHEH